MAQIRTAIELLTTILFENGTSLLIAEIFRLAKFNKDEAVVPLWRLIFELICYCKYDKIDDITRNAGQQMSQDDLVALVKQELLLRGYRSVDFAKLPDDASSGSRELLLAFGWMLCREKLIQRFMMNRTTLLEDDDDFTQFFEQQNNSDVTHEKSIRTSNIPSDPSHRVQQLLVLNNKLRLSLNSLYSLQCEKNILKHKIYEATFGVQDGNPEREHLSMLEVHLLRHPEDLKKSIDLLEEDNRRLQNLLNWRDQEGVFWKWMESVLEAKTVSTSPLSSEDSRRSVRSPKVNNLIQTSAAMRLHQSHKRLHDIIIKYESIVEHLERVCENKISQVTTKELDLLIASINQELSIQKANATMNFGSDDSLHAWKESSNVGPRFVLQGKKKDEARNTLMSSAKHLGYSSSSSSTITPSDITTTEAADIDDNTDELQQLVDRMEKDVRQKQDQLQMEIENLSYKFTDCVCIPPLLEKSMQRMNKYR